MDIQQIMSNIQNKLGKTHEMLEGFTFKQNIGGENGVSVSINGKFHVKDIKISFIPNNKEDVEMLQVMLLQAFTECGKRVEEYITNSIK